jgi:eukaryotic-like serine/threonine-protein kinase
VGKQAAYLDEACAGDPGLRAEVERLRRSAASTASGFLAGSALAEMASGFPAAGDLGNRLVGGYRVQRLLGSGGMGDVYLAVDERLGRQVALKVLPAAFLGETDRVHRFEREARSVSSLNHPNILTLLDIVDFEGGPCLVLEFVDGETLRERLRHGRLEPLAAIEVALQIAAALQAAHAAGFVHRDIKPENVMLRRDGVVKVLDFGLAKLAQSTAAGPPAGDAAAAAAPALSSAPGVVLGTLAYMSPEQSRGLAVDSRSDLFSLGMVLNEMVAQRPAGLAKIVERLLRADREERYATAQELIVDLKELRWELESGSRPPVPAARPRRSRRNLGLAALLLLVGIGAVVLVQHSRARAPALGERDTILLAEFENATGEPLFDFTLARALAVYLEQSPYLSLFPEASVRQTLRYMQQPDDRPLSRAVAREVCQRNGIKASVAGRIAALGDRYVVTLEATQAENGETLASTLAEAASKEQVLAALQRAAAELRSRLGESLESVSALDAPLEQVTTSSFEALRDFALAREQMSLGRFAAAIPLLEKAVERDAEFASAYANLATAYRSTGNNARDRSNAERAYALRARVSEREALFITQQYESFVLGDLDQTVATLRRWRLAYPRDHAPGSLLASTLLLLGRYEEAVRECRASIELNPNDVTAYTNLGLALAILGRADEARATLALAEARGLASRYLRYSLSARSWLEVDDNARRQELERAATSDAGPAGEAAALNRASSWASELGQRQRAFALAQRSWEVAEIVDRGLAGRYAFESALRDAAAGHCEQVDVAGRRTMEWTDGAWAVSGVALALALCGGTEVASATIEELSVANPHNTLIQRAARPATMAAIALHAARYAEALTWLETTVPYETGIYAVRWPVYIRGLVYLSAGRAAEAVSEFQRVVDNEGLRIGHSFAPSGSMARLQLARAAVAAGELATARRAYDELLERWRGADPDLGALAEARAERLRLTESRAPRSPNP